jgi:small subunit ribosomal protein S15
MLEKKEKEKLVKEYKIHEEDTGSPEVQVALLTKEIDRLVSHLKKHPKDFGSKKGFLKMVAKRKKFLNYLKEVNVKRYNLLIKRVGIKK